MLKIITLLILCLTVAAMAAHAYRQPSFNELAKIDAEAEAYRRSAVIGWWKTDGTGQLYFVNK